MSWLRLDDGFADHPKLLELTRADRWRWIELLTLTARYRTNGHITSGMLRSADIPPRLQTRLLELALLEQTPYGQLQIHDWHHYNPPPDPTGAARQARWRARHTTRHPVDNPGDKSSQSVENLLGKTKIRSEANPPHKTKHAQTPHTTTPKPPSIPAPRNALRNEKRNAPRNAKVTDPVPVLLKTTTAKAELPVLKQAQQPVENHPDTPVDASSGGGPLSADVAGELERLRLLAGEPVGWSEEVA